MLRRGGSVIESDIYSYLYSSAMTRLTMRLLIELPKQEPEQSQIPVRTGHDKDIDPLKFELVPESISGFNF